MKRRTKRFIPLIVALIVIGLVFVYIRFFNGNLIYLSTGFKSSQVCKVDGEVTDTMQADILLADAKKEYQNVFGDDVWNQTMDGVNFDDYVKDQVRTKLIRVRCMNLLAKERGVVLSRSQKDNVSDAVDAYMAQLSQDQIDKLDITKEKLTTMFTEFTIAQTLYTDVTDALNCEISADDARVIKIQYICTDNQENITKAKSELGGGESFYVVAKRYNTSDENEIELKRGEMDHAFEEAAFNLKSGETSDIVSADGKFYIIKCTSDNQKSKTEANKASLLEQKKLEGFNQTFDAYEASKYVEFNNKLWKNRKVAKAQELSMSFEDVFDTYLK